MRSFEGTMADLGLAELDLYLIPWPAPSKGLALETWKALVELKEQGRIRSIGVSNFRVEDLERVEAETGIVPVLNQIELDRKSTRLNSSHVAISYADFCLKKKKKR